MGLLQKEVAEQLGVDTASICNWESNESQPMVHCLPGIIAFLGHNPLPEGDDLISKFKRVRSTLGLSQEQLAQKLGIDESTIAGWERGENLPVGAYRKLLEEFVARDGDFPKLSRPTSRTNFSPRKITALRRKLGLTSGPRQGAGDQREHPLALGTGGPKASRVAPESHRRPDAKNRVKPRSSHPTGALGPRGPSKSA